MKKDIRRDIFYTGLLAALTTALGLSSASADEGFYGSIMFGEEFADARLNKLVGQTNARDSENEEDMMFGIAVGYQFSLAPRTHLKTELDFAAHKQAIHGFLDGTGTDPEDVWPGAWSVEKNRSAGLTFKLGYEPEAINPIDSIYLLTGVRWLPLTGEVHANGNAAPNQPIAAVSRRDFDVRPWVIGTGATFEALETGQFNFELRYMDYGFDWFFPGDSDPADTIIRHDIDVNEWKLLFGYSWELDM